MLSLKTCFPFLINLFCFLFFKIFPENSLPPTPQKFKSNTPNRHDELPVPSPIPPSPTYNDTIEERKNSDSTNCASDHSAPEATNANTALNDDELNEPDIRNETKDDMNKQGQHVNNNSISNNERDIPNSDKQIESVEPSIETNNPISISIVADPEPDSEYDTYNRSESPPSLELVPQKFSDNECDINVNNDDDFDDFIDHQNYQSNQYLDINVNKSDDSTSLPSLNLDSMRNTPIFGRTDDCEDTRLDGDNENKLNDINDQRKDPNDNQSETNDSEPNLSDVADEWNEHQSVDDNLPIHITANALDSYLNEPAGEKVATENFAENDAAFDADFSQFSAFESGDTPGAVGAEPSTSDSKCAADLDVDSANVGDLDNNLGDDIDDFGDFEEATKEAKNALDDDDFGEFSDFQQQAPNETDPTADLTINSKTSIVNTDVTQINLQTIQTKLKPLLNKLFPVDNNESSPTEAENGNQNTNKISQKEEFLTNIVQNLKDFENSNALSHQWASSSGKSSLVKALGIDSRNIVITFSLNCACLPFKLTFQNSIIIIYIAVVR